MGILTVHIPSQFTAEIEYTVKCLLSEFLGLKFDFMKSKGDDIVIKSQKGDIIIKNHFFKGGDHDSLFQKKNIPSNVNEGEIEIYGNTHSIISLFGTSQISINERSLVLESDIISSTFFMLSRWEEYANNSRDSHNRFPASASIAQTFGFLDRPIVNEYVELLWSMLQYVGCTQKRKKRKYEIVPTHDVDRPFLFNSLKKNIRTVGGFVKRGNFRQLIDFFNLFIRNRDPWNTHELFMDLSERAGVKSNFFFLPKGKNKHDETYEFDDPRIKRLFKKIRERGHHIGLHPSYDAYNNLELFHDEKLRLEKALGEEVNIGRQHYLRFELPKTWQIWESCNMKWDSTLSYADRAGFRCGVCYPFPVFDVLTRQQLNLHEKPLLIMEGTLIGYEGLDLESAINRINALKNQVKKYNGEFVFLYHNSAFFDDNYFKIGERLLNAFYE